MAWTKGQLMIEAMGEIGLGSYQFDIQPGEQATVLRRLDALWATWEAKGIRLGYNFPTSPDQSDASDDSGLPDSAAEATYTALAIRIAPGFGKAVSQDTRVSARVGYEAMLFAAAQPIEQQLPSTLPRGAGNKPFRTPNDRFFPVPDTDPLQVDCSDSLDILPE